MSLRKDINKMNQVTWKHKLGDVVALERHVQFHPKATFWYVDAANGNDNGSGEDVDHAVQSIQQALYNISLKRTATGKVYEDVIFLLPTNAVDYDDDTVGNTAKGGLANAYVYINQANIRIRGIGIPGGVLIKPDAAATAGIFAIGTSADRLEISGIRFDCTTAANECIDVPSGGANDVHIHDCIFDGQGGAAAAGIVTGNAATCARWVIENNQFIDCTVAAIKGYLGHGLIRNNVFIKTMTGAMTDGISLLDNTTTADSDGCVIRDNLVLGGIEGTTPLATGIKVAGACYGVGIVDNRAAGCTDNLSHTANTAATHAIENATGDGRNGGAEYADTEDRLNS
jgi:hypothetical protein